MKNWTFAGNSVSINTNWPNLNLAPSSRNGAMPVGINTYGWLYAEVNDAPGIPGQSSGNPASFFRQHYTAFLNGKYYDPSYGVRSGGLDEIQQSMIAGFVVSSERYVYEPDFGVDLNNDGKISAIQVNCTLCYFRKPTNELEIMDEISNH